ncbi:MAG: flavodoxin domain-containing protein [Anaerolineae bacterium]
MAKRILVTYGSWCGSTAEIAEAIAETLRQDGSLVDVMPVKEVGDLNSYRGVVVGTAIRAGRCRGDVKRFVQSNATALQRIPVAYFTVGMAMQAGTEEDRAKTADALKPLRSAVKPVQEAYLAGVMDAGKLTFPMNVMMKNTPQTDARDWEAIRSWAEDLRPMLLGLQRA